MYSKPIVIDANILVRAVLGERVRNLIIEHHQAVEFFIPDVCVADAQKYLPILFEKRKLRSDIAIDLLEKILTLLNVVDIDLYEQNQSEAEERMKHRDLDDWPIVATALTLDCPIWTEDKDFFGSGMPTWTTDRIHLFLGK